MDPDMSRSILAAAEKKAMELGIRVAICVVDAGGNIVMFERRNGPQLASTVIAQGKAYTAVARRAPSGNLWPIAQPGAAGYGINTIDSCFVLSVGGVPIIFGDDVSGGIGVSGGTAEQDEICAHAALSAQLDPTSTACGSRHTKEKMEWL
jgi:cob(I)alamin adenosyltransferase